MKKTAQGNQAGRKFDMLGLQRHLGPSVSNSSPEKNPGLKRECLKTGFSTDLDIDE